MTTKKLTIVRSEYMTMVMAGETKSKNDWKRSIRNGV